MTLPPPPNRPPLARAPQSPGDWLQRHAKTIGIAAVVVAAAGGGVYLYQRTTASTAQRAEGQYFAAQAMGGAANPAEQERALDAVIGSFGGTPSATQAAMLLAQLRYNRGAYAEGVAALERVANDAGEFGPAVDALIAAGLEGQAKFAEAAARYREAADAARFDEEKQSYMADAARALRAAGNEAEAARIWTDLAADPTSGSAAEARVRLGELTAKAAGRS